MLDREQISLGDNFLEFMEAALSKCDYCLLLWSKAASQRPWVQLEWEAALYRTIQESRKFLVVGRLEDYPVPALLAPRLKIDLFPDSLLGIRNLIQLWKEDTFAARATHRPVGLPAMPLTDDSSGSTVYITSNLFSLTIPVQLYFHIPTGMHLDRLIADLHLPTVFDYQGKLGVHLEYRLVHNKMNMERDKSLADQGAKPGDVLWLEVTMKPFSSVMPIRGKLETVSFRGDEPDDENWSVARQAAHIQLLTAISRAGLGL